MGTDDQDWRLRVELILLRPHIKPLREALGMYLEYLVSGTQGDDLLGDL